MVYQWIEELSIRTNNTNHNVSLMNGDFFTNGTIGEGFFTIGMFVHIRHAWLETNRSSCYGQK